MSGTVVKTKKRTLPAWMINKNRKKKSGNSEKTKSKVKQSERIDKLFDDLNPRRINQSDDENMGFRELQNMSSVDYTGKIHYLTDFYEVAETFDKLNAKVNEKALNSEDKIPVAFDLEWSFDYTSGPTKTSVLQICLDLSECYIVQLSKLKKIPASIAVFLNNKHTILHGVNIKNDFRKLERDFPNILGFKADPLIEKCVDLRTYHNNVFNSSEIWSLARLCAHTLILKMDKSTRNSNWDYYPLSKKQLLYASIDVFVGQKIYYYINENEKENSGKINSFFNLEDIETAEKSDTNLEAHINELMNF